MFDAADFVRRIESGELDASLTQELEKLSLEELFRVVQLMSEAAGEAAATDSAP